VLVLPDQGKEINIMLKHDIDQASWLRTYTLLNGLLVLVLLATAGAGLFGTGIYEPFSPPKYVQESRAQDLITLLLGVPLLIVALYGVRHGRAWAFPLWTGVLAYELYVYAIYTVGGVYNAFFPGYLAAASLSLYTIIGLLSSVDPARFRQQFGNRLPRRWIGGFFALIVVLFGAIWIGEVLNSISSGVQADGHLIFVFDLVIVLPAFGIAAFKLFRGQPFGDLLAGMLLIKFISLCVSITLGQAFRALNGISVETGLLGVFIPLGLVGLGLAAAYLRQG
jgi:hypothetical protein